jgi:beta-lactamase regulating signal transducer with metallopeptidase domain
LVVPVEFWGAKEITVWRAYSYLYRLFHGEVFFGISLGRLLLGLWGLSAAYLIVSYYQGVLLADKIAQRAVLVVEGDRLYEILEKAKREVGYSGYVRLAVSKELDMALSIGTRTPSVLLFEEMLSYSDFELEGVLRHEITHYMRGDVIKQRLLILMQCMFWWNPIIHYLRKCLESMLEMECDEYACRGMTEEEQVVYLNAITKILRSENPRTIYFGMAFGKRITAWLLKRRFSEVLHPVVKHSNAVTRILAVISLILFCLSYSIIFQPGETPTEMEKHEVRENDISGQNDGTGGAEEFLIRLPDGSYLYVSDMLGQTVLSSDEILKEPYVDLPIYDNTGKGD